MKVVDLIKLVEKTINLFDKYVLENDLKPDKRLFIKSSPTKLTVTLSNVSSSSSMKIIEKEDWNVIIYHFLSQEILSTNLFENLLSSIIKKYKDNIKKIIPIENIKSQVKFWLQNFLTYILNKNMENLLTKEEIIEYAASFRSELDLSPIEQHHKYYLDGIFLEDEKIIIDESCLIRKIIESDLEYTKDIFFDFEKSYYANIPPSILEINMFTNDEVDLYNKKECILHALRLYKLGSIFSQKRITTKKSYMWSMPNGFDYAYKIYSSYEKYSIKKEESDIFIQFIRYIEDKLLFDENDKKYWNLSISLERYDSSLLEPIDIDRKIMTAVMGLESLFTLESDKGENSYKLSIRVAKLLGLFNYNMNDVRFNVFKAYNYRNKVVHGLYISTTDKKIRKQLFYDIINYLRNSLIIFLSLKEIGKNKLVDMLDKSLIDKNYEIQIKKLIDNELFNYNSLLYKS